MEKFIAKITLSIKIFNREIYRQKSASKFNLQKIVTFLKIGIKINPGKMIENTLILLITIGVFFMFAENISVELFRRSFLSNLLVGDVMDCGNLSSCLVFSKNGCCKSWSQNKVTYFGRNYFFVEALYICALNYGYFLAALHGIRIFSMYNGERLLRVRFKRIFMVTIKISVPQQRRRSRYTSKEKN